MTWPDARTKGPFINDVVSKSTPFFLLLYIKAVGFFQCFDNLSPISTGFYKYPQSNLDPFFDPRHCRCRILMAPNTLSRILSEAVGSCLAGHFVRIDTDSIVKLSSATDFVHTLPQFVPSAPQFSVQSVAKLATMC